MDTHELASAIQALSNEEKHLLWKMLGIKVIQPHTDVHNLPVPTCPQGYVFSNGRCVPDVG